MVVSTEIQKRYASQRPTVWTNSVLVFRCSACDRFGCRRRFVSLIALRSTILLPLLSKRGGSGPRLP